MKIKYFINITVCLFIFLSSCYSYGQESKFPVLKGPYLGQKLPDTIPKLFAPDFISIEGRYEFAVSFSPKLDEIYFSADDGKDNTGVYFSKKLENKWSYPQKADFTGGKKKSEMEAFFTPDGNKIFFAAYDSMDIKIWFVERTPKGWSDPEYLDSPANSTMVFYPTTASNGDLYYSNIQERKIYYAPFKNGGYPEVFDSGIEFGGHPFIAPDGSYLLLDAINEKDQAKRDIYICFRQKNSSWSQPINLGKHINTEYSETCPSVTPDGKYIFFGRYNEPDEKSNIYWVDAKIIEHLKTKYLSNK